MGEKGIQTIKGSLHWCRTCYAVDPRPASPVVLRAERRGAQVRTTKVDPEDPDFRAASVTGIPIVSVVTAAKSMIREIETPLRSRRKARRVLPTLLDIQLPFPLHQSTYTIVAEGQTADGRPRWRVAVTRETDARELLERFHEQEQTVMALDCQGLAMWTQAALETPGDSAGRHRLRVVIELAGPTSAVVLGRGSSFLAAHAIRTPTVAAIQRLVQAQLSDQDREVAWIWTGEGALDPGLLDAVRIPLENWMHGPSKILDEPDGFLARALATRALADGPLRCNLLTGELLPTTIRRRRNQASLRGAVVLAFAGLLLIAGNVLVRHALRTRENRIDQVFAELRDRMLGYSLPVKGPKAIQAVRQRIDEQKQARSPLLESMNPSLTHPLATILRAASSQQIRIKELKLRPDTVLVSGMTPSKAAAEALAGALHVYGYEARSALGAAGNGGDAPFTVEGRRTNE